MGVMPIKQAVQQRVRALKSTSDDEAFSDSEDIASGDESAPDTDDSDGDPANLEDGRSDRESTTKSNTSSSPQSYDPSSLSFGGLARAQKTIGKRKGPSPEASPPPKRLRQAGDPAPYSRKTPLPSRSSKHAPTVLSSKRAVTRRREVVSAPKVIARDPRFDPLTGPLDSNRVAQNYSFLSNYQASEISQLKTAIRNTKDVSARERLQRALKRMESRRKTDALKEERQKVVREHRKQERERVQEGKQPYYLKEAEVRNKMLERRFEGLGEKRLEKVIEKRRKKQAGREKKMLPERRMLGEGA